MDILLNKKEDFNCDKCKKKYSSYKTLWTHNKKYHIDINIESKPESKHFGKHEDFLFMNIMLQFNNIPFRNKQQSERKELLNAREGFYIESMTCVNKS